jgi:F-type H+-transporting ATPase subunit delta
VPVLHHPITQSTHHQIKTMPNPRLAARYAKSLIGLAVEKNQLEVVHADMKYLEAVCRSSREFVNMLRSPIIKADAKTKIIDAVTSGKVSELTAAFNKLLALKGRESELPEIITSFIEQYNTIKGISKATLVTATELSADLKKSIELKLTEEAGLKAVELHTKVDESIIGGFILEFEGKLVDASIARDLRDIKKQFNKNIYIHNIR